MEPQVCIEESEQHWATDTIGPHTPALDKSLQEAARLETFGRLAVGVSHDFKNLLQVIVGNLYLLESVVAADATALKRLQTARRAAHRGAQLIERLLALARPAGESENVIDVAQAIEGIKILLERALGRKTTFETEVSESQLTIKVDVSQLESALVNLVINARDAMPDGGRVRLAASATHLDAAQAMRLHVETGEYVEICVIDNGQGIPSELLNRVLEPFFTTKPKGKGSGLGLPMVQAFARSVGGQLKIDSRVGHGTAVTLVLPRSRGVAPKSLDDTAMMPGLVKRRGRVVVAEPDMDVRQALQGILKTLGFDALPVGALAEIPVALRKARDARFLMLDEGFVAGAAAAERVLATIHKAAPEITTVWLGSADSVAGRADVRVLEKPVTRGALARALNVVSE